MQRSVTGTVLHTDGTPWVAGRVRFRLLPGSFTPENQQPADTVIVTADASGNISVTLWANEEGEAESKYYCTLPSAEQFVFTLPPGDGSPIALSLLREVGVTATDPQYQSILTYVLQNAIEPAQEATAAAQAVVDEYHGVLLVAEDVDYVTLRPIDQVTFVESTDVIDVNGTLYEVDVVTIQGALP